MLIRIRILQVGDIHLPTSSKPRTAVDAKDGRFPVDLKTTISDAPVKAVFKQIYKIIEAGDVGGIVFMGDLTDYGDMPGYTACANYISRSLQLGAGGIHDNIPVSVLPGNHDIKRELAKAPGPTTKFMPLQEALTRAGLPQFPLHKPGWLKVTSGNATVAIGLLNSCWGCGSMEHIPDEFRESVSHAIDAAISAGNSEKATQAYYNRQLDTPAFADATIKDLGTFASDKAAFELLVISAHHNLLPQRQPRLAPYTELVNSGALRSALLDLRRPVLYLHGHIHDDPIEVLSGPEADPLILISAPLITDGFNVLDLTFTRTGAPLSCHLVPWRVDSAGTIRRKQTVVLPLLGRRRRSHDRGLARMYSYILDQREVYWSELIKKIDGIL